MVSTAPTFDLVSSTSSQPSSSPCSKPYLSSAPSSAFTSEHISGPSSELATCVAYGVDSANFWSNVVTFVFSDLSLAFSFEEAFFEECAFSSFKV